MLKGYTHPRTVSGVSSIVPSPPWHYVGDVMAVTFEASFDAVKGLLPKGLKPVNNHCCVYFIEWQYASDEGREYLDPAYSQYRETIFLISVSYKGETVAYCPFIWVDQDRSLMRGLIQGWPKQLGETFLTRCYDLPSKAGVSLAQGTEHGATLFANHRQLATAKIKLQNITKALPTPTFSGAMLNRYFPELIKSEQAKPKFDELVKLKSRDVSVSTIWEGDAELMLFDHPYTELSCLQPERVGKGYRFSIALTVDDLSLCADD